MATRALMVSVMTAAAGFATASAQLIRPDTATATSEFNANYRALNMINGSGLPAGFTTASAHANYSTGNHWTTRLGETIGQSATFGFSQPQTLGGFHMWNHRSNIIASNPHYAVTRFDLVFRDGDGAVLATVAGVPAVGNIATAQTFPFEQVEGVRSVQFIVRATANNNSSPYTGLAEVAFAECLEVIAPAPAGVTTCTSDWASVTVEPTGTGPFQYRWQVEDAGEPGGWRDISDGEDEALQVTFAGAAMDSLGILGTTDGGPTGVRNLRVRCVVMNPCGQSESDAAAIAMCACLECPADFNQDGGIDGADVDAFFAAWEGGVCDADVNADGGVDGTDVDTFYAAWEAGGCG